MPERKYEYRVEKSVFSPDSTYFNAMDEQGWELISVSYNSKHLQWYYIFRKEISK